MIAGTIEGVNVANILVNGMKSKVGGGKVIFDTYLRLLAESRPTDTYYILTPDREAYVSHETDRIKIIDVPGWAHSNFATIPLYRFIFPRLLKRYAIDAILNFGDIIIPTDIRQIYNFDWPHAVYPEHLKGMSMGKAERVLYAVKLHYFEAFLNRATVIMAQTIVMKERLERRYALSNVVLVPAAVTRTAAAQDAPFPLPQGKSWLVYPSNYYPHKNIEALLSVATRLKASGSDVGFVTTLDPEEHEAAAEFIRRVKELLLDDMIVNVGRLPASRVPSLFKASSGLLMPTLLETFGLPYVEAMQQERPIVTSDRDFARAVCGDAAIYFDPENAESIAGAVSKLGDKSLSDELVAKGRERLSQMWDWPMVFNEYQRLLTAR